MARVTERIVKDVSLVYTGVINIQELLDLLRKWCKKHNYDIEEKEHRSKETEAGKIWRLNGHAIGSRMIIISII